MRAPQEFGQRHGVLYFGFAEALRGFQPTQAAERVIGLANLCGLAGVELVEGAERSPPAKVAAS